MQNSQKIKMSAGFTFVEMAIVMLIVTLLIAGIYETDNLIQINRRNAVVADLQKYSAAYHGFKEKFGYPPGDYPEIILADLGSVGEDCTLANGNTNGSGIINNNRGGAVEGFCAWRQLAQAGFIEGEYDMGAVGDSVENSPMGPYGNSHYVFDHLMFLHPLPAPGSVYGNTDAIIFGTLAADELSSDGAFATPELAQSMDIKMDDGLPLRGKFFGFIGNGLGGVTGTCINFDISVADYYVEATYAMPDDENIECYIMALMEDPYRIAQ